MSLNIRPGERNEVQALIDEVVETIVRHIPEGPLRVYLFGSWVEGHALNVSDLDIAFDTERELGFDTYTDIALDVDDLPTLRKIDIVDVHSIGDGFRESILKRGELLYAR